MLEWHLQSEPSVFLIAARGTIAAEFEAIAAADELKLAVNQLLNPG